MFIDYFWYERLSNADVRGVRLLIERYTREFVYADKSTQYIDKPGKFFRWLSDREEGIEMPRKSTKKGNENGNSGAAKREFTGWHNCPLPDDCVSEVERLASDPASVVTEFLALLEQGADVGVKRQPDGGGWMAYLITDACDVAGKSVGLSAFASSPIDAAACLVYKYNVLLECEIPAHVLPSKRRFG